MDWSRWGRPIAPPPDLQLEDDDGAGLGRGPRRHVDAERDRHQARLGGRSDFTPVQLGLVHLRALPPAFVAFYTAEIAICVAVDSLPPAAVAFYAAVAATLSVSLAATLGVALAIVSFKGRRRTEAEVNLSCQRWLPCGRYSRSRG